MGLIRSTLADLLPDVAFRTIDKTGKTLIFDTADGPVALEDLSDGYQNVAAWVGDLLYCTTAVLDDGSEPLATPGLLLLDEIDLHLHVKWQRRLRRFIEQKLPRFQIVATTHSPMTAPADEPRRSPASGAPGTQGAAEAPTVRGRSRHTRAASTHRAVLLASTPFDSARVAQIKDAYRALKARKRKSAAEKRQMEALREQLADAPAWNGGEEIKAQTEVLRSIRALIEKSGDNLPGAAGAEPAMRERPGTQLGRRAIDK